MSLKIMLEKFKQIKKSHFAYFPFVINGKMVADIRDESAEHSLHTNTMIATFWFLKL